MTVPGLTRFVALPARARQPVENMDNSMRMRRTMFTSAGGVMTVWYLFSNLDSWSLEIICQPFVSVTTTQHSPLGQIVSVSHQVWFFAFLLSPPQACTGVVSSKVQISEVLSNWLGTTSCSRVRLYVWRIEFSGLEFDMSSVSRITVMYERVLFTAVVCSEDSWSITWRAYFQEIRNWILWDPRP